MAIVLLALAISGYFCLRANEEDAETEPKRDDA
jgi:hypothetical protein